MVTAVIAAGVITGGIGLAALAPEVAAWVLANPILANTLGIITVDTAAALKSGAILPGSAAEGLAARAAGASFSRVVPGGGLVAHELAGGHTIDRHIVQTLSDLAARDIKFASTFSSRATAENAIATAIDVNAPLIQSFLTNGDTRLAFTTALTAPIGYGTPQGSTVAQILSTVNVVLIKDASMPLGYRILTAYPK